MNGKLYWITGLAGAGKTTIGNALYYELKKTKNDVILLDGDVLRKIFGGGYSREERLERAKQYSNLCKVLTDQGMTVIICTIAMFESIREYNRENIRNYIEIFLDVDIDILRKRDRKGLYTKYKNGGVEDVAGVDLEVEFPEKPDLILQNDGSLSVKECVRRILEIKDKANGLRDVEYWNRYYKTHQPGAEKPSQFAMDMYKYMQPEKSLLDLGCGNGRDSLFFAKNNIQVTGIDASKEAINLLNAYSGDSINTLFICDDFVSSSALFQQQYDYCYSRFTMHTIDEQQEKILLENVYEALKDNGLFFIEARSINDSIYGKGTNVGRNEFIYNDHYRRFIEKEELQNKLIENGFKIKFIVEGQDFALTENSNPTLIRVIAQK